MTKPTVFEVQKEIKTLQEMKPNVRHTTAFGDDNWAAIEAQVRVLEHNMGDDDIWDYWSSDDTEEYERSAAREALAWREGEEDESPSESWKSLVSKDD